MTERDDTNTGPNAGPDPDSKQPPREGAEGGPSRDPSSGVIDLSGSDNGWLWLLIIAVFPATFLVSYFLLAKDRLGIAANPPGVRIGVVSQLYGTDAVIALIFGGLTMLILLYFSYRYFAGNVSEPKRLQSKWGANTFRLLIIGVAVIMIVTFMFAGTSLAHTDQMSAHDAKTRYNAQDELNMTVVGSQWAWRDTVQGVNYTETDKVYVPANTLISVRITSADVDHSWAVEQLGIKKDAIPGQVTQTWFDAKKPGTYQVNCAELCGAGHSDMTQKIVVLPKQQYIQWAHSHGYNVPFADNSTSGNSTSPNSSSDLTAPGAEVTTGV